MTALRFENVHVHFGRGSRAFHAVRGVDLEVASGRIMGLVGESGSGKSTLARAAVGLVEPSSGRIAADGVDLVHAKGAARALRRRIQMIFQDPSACLDPRMTISDSIAEALTAAARRDGKPRPRRTEITAQVERLLQTVHLDPRKAHDLPTAFSGGQRQRIAIARALAAAPTVLLADEITSALDVSVQGAVLNLLLELQRELQLTMLFVSHNLAVVRYVCDDVAVMRHGELVETGPVLDVIDNPQHEYTRGLMAAIPQLGETLFR
ncbi:peptide/nickel transport system ATP-binding protein [Microbacterium keratanolyticum]|uniref:Dipeptide/oligopeptide/nickel ABC transporter ATP-binding protein n=1 Tax=Microbacterium keratanolyticum TaxID=67574 RepID=A0A9W6M7R1_9MICO|nr:ATP-binding cassette domain-containing protein [Microbacterium keratanolyticum]MBM7468637.1 peptide/nickel transport system ATP-binding protein [Microbacterium keratanolyticum]GLK00712.1 dipeptide/oligopeptide/nickel ABC transporter ATP-binding protein [Microbacterium keratanolyticum]